MDEEIELALLKAVWISRWNEDGTVLSAVLTPEEAKSICVDIFDELHKSGYKIVSDGTKNIRKTK